MKRSYYPLLLLLALLSVTSGYLMSKATWIGRVGITFFHKGYNLIKIWWQGAIAVFLVFVLLLFIHDFLQRKLPAVSARLVHIFILILAATGLYFNYDDFHTDITHRLLGRHFHYGFYLVWVGWIIICLFFAARSKADVRAGEETR